MGTTKKSLGQYIACHEGVLSSLFCYLFLNRQYKVAKAFADAKYPTYTPSQVFHHNHIVTLGRAVDPKVALPSYLKYKEALLVPVRTQGDCASCWAFAIADMLADRISLHTRGRVITHLSPQELLSCFMPWFFPCKQGGIPEIALYYAIVRGLLSEKAYPYENESSTKISSCKTGRRMSVMELWNVDAGRHEKKPERVFAKDGSIRSLCDEPSSQEVIDKNVENMKVEIMTNGPIIGTVHVHDDLYDYDGSSVYEVGPNAKLLGGHAVVIFGWSDAGANTDEVGFQGAYWHVRNSWLMWPKNLPHKHTGWFYVKMGTNESGIESRASCASPLLTDAVKAMGKDSSWLSTAYTSYGAYVQDPERQNFFAHLADRRKKDYAI